MSYNEKHQDQAKTVSQQDFVLGRKGTIHKNVQEQRKIPSENLRNSKKKKKLPTHLCWLAFVT